MGGIVAVAPNLQPVVDLLKLAPGNSDIAVDDVRKVLNSWGAGKFDAELFLDGKAFTRSCVPNDEPRGHFRTRTRSLHVPPKQGRFYHDGRFQTLFDVVDS